MIVHIITVWTGLHDYMIVHTITVWTGLHYCISVHIISVNWLTWQYNCPHNHNVNRPTWLCDMWQDFVLDMYHQPLMTCPPCGHAYTTVWSVHIITILSAQHLVAHCPATYENCITTWTIKVLHTTLSTGHISQLQVYTQYPGLFYPAL